MDALVDDSLRGLAITGGSQREAEILDFFFLVGSVRVKSGYQRGPFASTRKKGSLHLRAMDGFASTESPMNRVCGPLGGCGRWVCQLPLSEKVSIAFSVSIRLTTARVRSR